MLYLVRHVEDQQDKLTKRWKTFPPLHAMSIETSEWASVALIAVAAMSLLALSVAVIALARTGHHE
jgi:hypothetical protein